MVVAKSTKELRQDRALKRYKNWLNGQKDRLDKAPCISNNGDYLDGFYSPDAIIPDFLTQNEAADLRRILNAQSNGSRKVSSGPSKENRS